MNNNKIHYVDKTEIQNIKNKFSKISTVNIIEIDGAQYRTFDELILFFEYTLHFPWTCTNINAFDDFMRDLSWENYDEYIFIIDNISLFLNEDPDGKKMFFECFEEYMRFWEYDVTRVMVCGKTKKFNLYIVDERL